MQHKIVCPECGQAFLAADFELMDIFDDVGVIEATCRKCGLGVMVNVSIKKGTTPTETKIELVAPVTKTDLRMVGRFMKGYQGGFKELFEKALPAKRTKDA